MTLSNQGVEVSSVDEVMTTSRIPVSAETAPIPISGSRGWRDVAQTMRIGNYRFVFTSMLAGSIANWMSRVAQDWMLLELTGNVALVGLAVTFQFTPVLLFGLWGGVLSDRFPRLRIVLISHSVTTASLVALSVLTLTGSIQIWQIYLAASLTGFAAVAESPARTALVTQIVPPSRIQTAISINAMTFHGSGLIGPALSGAVIAAFGAGWSLLSALCLSVVSLTSLACIRRSALHPVTPSDRTSGVRDAIRYAKRKPTIRWPLVILAFLATFGMTHTVLYAAAASGVGYDTGAAGYGFYMALGALGAVTGAILSTRRSTVGLRSVVFAATSFGVFMLVAAGAPWQGLFLAAIVALSTCRILFGTAAESLLQISSNPSIRGRVAALYFVIMTGGQTGGAVLIGWIAQTYGIHIAYAVAGGIPLLASCGVGIAIARERQLRVRVRLRNPRRLVRIEPVLDA